MGDELDTTDVETNEGSGENPSWQELYAVLPDSLHSVVAPVLEKWESGTQAKFTQYADTQKSYEPYQQFIDNNVGSDQIEQALSVAQLIDQDPQAFMEQMKAYFGSNETPQPDTESDDNSDSFDTEKYDLSTDPQFKQIQEQQNTIAGYLANQMQSQQAAQEDAQLDSYINELTTKYGEFDQDYVFGMALNGVDLEQAVKQYGTLVENIRNKPAADSGLPNIVSPSGGMPSEHVNPADMSDAQRKALVMSVLAQANNRN